MNQVIHFNAVEFFATNYYERITLLCSNNYLYEQVLEQKGMYDIIDKSVSILIAKKPEVVANLEINKDSIERYFLEIVKNVIRNLTRNKELRNYIANSHKTISLAKIEDQVLFEDNFSYEIVTGENDDFDKIFRITEKLYENVFQGKHEECRNLIRYYKKIMESAKDQKIRALYESNLHLFYSSLYFDLGKLSLSKKHALESIKLYNQSDSVLGYEFIAGAYNNLALIELNQQDYSSGQKTFEFNISQLEKGLKNNRSYGNEMMLAKTRILYGMFSGNITSINKKKVFSDSLEVVELSNSEVLFKVYVETYLSIDTNQFSSAIEKLNTVKPTDFSFNRESVLNRIRFYVALAECMTYGFTAKNEKDLILSYCEEAQNGNKIIGSKYFDSMIKIIKGFALNDSESMLSGIKSLNQQGYVHYSNWYKKKIFG